MPIPDIAIGAVVAALIAAIVSLIGLIVSKEQKTSEFRQDWIDALRADVARLVAHATAMAANRSASYESPAAQLQALRDDLVGINEATANLRLRLNDKEAPSRAVLAAVEAIETLFYNTSPVTPDHLNPLLKDLVAKAKLVLKEEWLRVRRGEITFRIAKWAASALVLATVAAILWYILAASPGGHSPAAHVSLSNQTG
jgi:hypothetical protein